MEKTRPTLMSASFFIFLVIIFVSGCAGGKGFRMEISTGNSSGNLQSAAVETAKAPGDEKSKVKTLPEPTGDEYERLGDAILNKGDYYLAYVQYEKALGLNPDNLRIEYKKGLTLLMAEKNNDAIEQLNFVIKKDPQFSLAYEGLGRAHFQNRSYADAEKNFRKAVELNPKLWRSFDYLGNIFDYRKQHDRAIYEYSRAIQAKPDEGSLYNNLGVSYSMLGRPEEAVEAFEMAIERNFRESRVWNNLGLVLANLEEYDRAFEAFRNGGGPAQAYNNIGVVYLNQGRYADAVHCFKRAIEIEPSFYAKAGENLKKAEAMNQDK